jgi:hypothetical protein
MKRFKRKLKAVNMCEIEVESIKDRYVVNMREGDSLSVLNEGPQNDCNPPLSIQVKKLGLFRSIIKIQINPNKIARGDDYVCQS